MVELKADVRLLSFGTESMIARYPVQYDVQMYIHKHPEADCHLAWARGRRILHAPRSCTSLGR